MKNFLTQLTFLVFGLAIVTISLFSANAVYSQGEALELGNRRLYISDQITPDNLLYPLMAGIDRLKLEASDEEMKPWMKFVYAQRRVDYAEELLKTGYRGLAFSTLSKACKYHTEALVELGGNVDDTGMKMMLEEHQGFVKRVEFLLPSFLNKNQQELNRLLIEQRIVLESF